MRTACEVSINLYKTDKFNMTFVVIHAHKLLRIFWHQSLNDICIYAYVCKNKKSIPP